jgi:hypothetical protein
MEPMEPRLCLSAVLHPPAPTPAARLTHKPAVKATVKPAVHHAVKAPAKPAAKPAIKPAAKAHPKAKVKPAAKAKTAISAVKPATTAAGLTATGLASPGEITVGAPTASPLGGPSGARAPFSPSQIQQFYGVNSISFNGTAGDGTGQTIAVIDAFNDPKFVNSTDPSFASSDLHVFDQNFGLPDPPSFSVIPEAGASLPATYNAGWALETALDVEWAHAMAPKANIVLVECTSNTYDDLITAGTQAAVAAGATVVSMSFGGSEATYYDSSFTSSNVTFLASTGDKGVASTGYPSLSQYVVAVGGTSITTADAAANYGSEVVWNTSTSNNDGTGNNGSATGGGVSNYTSQPSYQYNETASGVSRGVPDVSFEADPYTGVSVLDTSQSGGGGYYEVGGTSLSSPCWAGLIAIADQGRALNGQPALSGYTDTLPRLYALPASAFHDITSGNNTDTDYSPAAGYSAGVGYDLASGIGTPVANNLVPDLAGTPTITGRVFVDKNGNGVYDTADSPLAGKTVFLDLNNNGIQDSNEPSTTTNASGLYTFTNQPAGGTVRLSSPSVAGYIAIPSNAVIAYGISNTINLTYFPIAFSTTTAATNYTLQTDASNSTEQILINNSLSYSVATSVLITSTLTFSLTGTGDSLTINGANGNPAAAGVTLTGATGGDTLTVDGTASGNDSFIVTSGSISFNTTPITFSNVSLLSLNPGSGTDSLNVTSGSVSITPQSPGLGILTRNFSNLNISTGSTALFATAPLHSDRMLVETASLSVLGKLDLGGNDLIVHNGSLATLTTLLGTGFANGAWNGNGIASSAAHSDPTRLTALGILQNTLYGGSGQPQFDGTSPVATDVLIKYTYYGDTTLDGKIDGTDYSRIDVGYFTHATGWANGDFNYDTHVDGSDYTLIDNAFNMQGAVM